MTATKTRTKKRTATDKCDYSIAKMRIQLVCEPVGQGKSRVAIRTPKDAERFMSYLKTEPEEHFIALHLSAKHEIIGLHEVSHGTLSASLVHPREVFKAALLANSYAILIAHNHPGGSNTPSIEDLDTTKQLIAAGKLMGVNVIDHLIFSSTPDMDSYSIRENHTGLWADED